MIQRIQSLFWLLSAVASGIMTFEPLLKIESSGIEKGLLFASDIKSTGAGEVILSCLPLLVLICIITLISVATIFLYKKRLLQMRLTVYNMVLMFGLIVLGYYYGHQGAIELNGSIKLASFTVMPIVSFILSLLAWRGVRRDYLMLKAVDRIR